MLWLFVVWCYCVVLLLLLCCVVMRCFIVLQCLEQCFHAEGNGLPLLALQSEEYKVRRIPVFKSMIRDVSPDSYSRNS